VTTITEGNTMQGTISRVENHGSIIVVWIDVKDGRSEPIYMDRRAFFWMVEAEGIEHVSELEGREVHFNGETIQFMDTLEAA
jgi:hypothetical protein